MAIEVRIVMAILLSHVCLVETFDFLGKSLDLQFSYTDGAVHHIGRRSADPVVYIMVVEVNASETIAISEIRSLVNSVVLPFQVDSDVEITAFNLSTVCSLNETQYQCKCEGLFVWPNDTCYLYEACDVITDGSCTCINALPTDGQFCQEQLSQFTYEYETEIDASLSDLFLVDYLRNLVTNTSLPFPLNNNINITDIDMTTVCGLNGTEYECQCEQDHVWPSDTCRAYQVCDGIVGGTCGCIQALPSEGPLCLKDINECKDAVSVCGPYSDCINFIGSHMCSCWSGFNTSNKDSPVSRNNSCQDINECLFSSPVCGPNSICTNQLGSYNCSCLDGFTATNSLLLISNNNTCRDVNECLQTTEVCGPNSRCTNLIGSYSCSCLTGYTVTNSSELVRARNPCNDINECLFSSPVCGPNANCTNEKGSYNCSCLDGFTATNLLLLISNNNTCRDINECLFSSPVCGPNANCTNVMGSYNCSCLDGFTATNSSLSISIINTCADVNECLQTTEVCGPNSRCTNLIGSYSCSCLTGYTVTNSSELVRARNPCNDVDECLFSSSVCGPNANCKNQLGSYNCSCLDGFSVTDSSLLISNNNTCRDMNECQFSPSVCGPNAYCTNEIGSYNCSCLDGFTASHPSLPISNNNTCTVPPPSPSSSSSSSSKPTTTSAPTVIGMSLTINQIFDIGLTDPTSKTYKDLSGKIESTINACYSDKLIGYIIGSASILRFRPGSVIADYTISATSSSLDFGAANAQVSESLRAQGIIVAENYAFAQSDQTYFTKDELYPLQKVDLNCKRTDSAKRPIAWTLDNNDLTGNTKYLLSNDNSTLTMKNASESDSGRYSCIIQRNTIPYIQWQKIIIKQRPSIIVGDRIRTFSCSASSFQLKCSVDAGYNIEWLVGTEEHISGFDSITLNYAPQKGNCTEETFTCRLKDLPQLQYFSYSYSSVTVKRIKGAYDCQNEELGVGNTNDVRTGVCGTGMKGTITYKCQSRDWKPEDDNCVLEVIDNLKNKLESLTVEGIPGFMANLSFATSENNIIITQSPATIKVIVEILFKIADLSQTAVITQTVMGNFLKTVDIIVSGNVRDTWSKLNNGNNTEDTSIKLLSAIENISDHLTDEFDILEKSIQLNRTTITNSFILTSALPNSTTEIVIPQVPQATIITIIIFTSLDNVLPSEGTNDSKKSDVRINGDVVVVKVNETLNNISFTFDITDQSLRKPQCVFWNFSLNTWDSTGCEVKQNSTGNITCECNHTTSFSILMSPFSLDHIALAYITYIGVAISMASLIICLIIEATVWKSVRRNDTSYMRHVSIVNIAVSLLIANICFIIGAAVTDKEQPTKEAHCSAPVFFMHFFYLAVFFWMLLSALLLFYRTVMVLSQMSRAKMMVIAFTVGYGASLLIAVITVASTAGQQKYTSKQACWLNWNESNALLAFVIPALTIVAINLVVLVVVLYKMLRRGVGATTQPDERHALVVIARCVAILTPIFGLTWGFGIGTMVSQELGIHVVFALLNSLQGFFILVFGTLLDRKVCESLPGKRLLQKLSSQTKSTSTRTSSASEMAFLQRRRQRQVYHVSEANHSSASSDSFSGSYTVLNT
ncbi:adhesion G protein-coupled receptor F5-like isoform X2 [Puntigrus tetrazona]|uniref:adhesion G protein-coupled receptor F5-like isoform X2 n=1 Tax=Puntigrus tetrazona TaxID=1606681 RepID=UPI001C89D3F4|nr:adhesion G protein-coupled receptor F5-like isoform X2 [Puntigrus tetrazona]